MALFKTSTISNPVIEYWIEHVTLGLSWVIFRFSIQIFYRGVPAFVTNCLCGVYCRELTTCLQYIVPLFGNLVRNGAGFENFTQWKTNFHCIQSYIQIWIYKYILVPHNMMIPYFYLPYFHFLNRALFFAKYFGTLNLHRSRLHVFYPCVEMIRRSNWQLEPYWTT